MNWIKTTLQALGMSTRQLGERIGLNQSTVVRQINNKEKCSIKTLKKLANGMNCDFVYMFKKGSK